QFVQWFTRTFSLDETARVGQWATTGYDAAFVEIFGALTSGATLCVTDQAQRVHAESVIEWIDRERVTVFQTVPSFLNELARCLDRKPDAGDVRHLKWMLVAGESLTADLARTWRQRCSSGQQMANLYGPTE